MRQHWWSGKRVSCIKSTALAKMREILMTAKDRAERADSRT